jgi:alkylation response protein AidB-like acyl-CoA dehydrogenase
VLLSNFERDALRTTARQVLADPSTGSEPAPWSTFVELGWTSIHVPEDLGGAGGTFADLAVVLHELGRALTPSPFLASAVLATGALLAADGGDVVAPLLTALAAGERVATVALASQSGSYERACRTVRLETDGGLRLGGSAGFVLDADLADDVVVAARTADGLEAVAVIPADAPGVRIERARTVDETRRLFGMHFDGVQLADDQLLTAPGARAGAILDRVLGLGVVAAAADAVGSAGRMLDVTVEYAKARHQFGKPIGSFQAVKHHCADMAIAIESSRAAVDRAAIDLDGGSDPITSAGIVASYVGPACSKACALGLLVHGGIGFTWEHEAHLHLKRVKLDEVLFGTPAWHRRRLFAHIQSVGSSA